MSAPLFDFDLLMTQFDHEGYYYTRWDKARTTRITVRAANQQEAINKAAAALGAPRRGWGWTGRVKKVTDAAVADSEVSR